MVVLVWTGLSPAFVSIHQPGGPGLPAWLQQSPLKAAHFPGEGGRLLAGGADSWLGAAERVRRSSRRAEAPPPHLDDLALQRHGYSSDVEQSWFLEC